jgi:hypothetical protein
MDAAASNQRQANVSQIDLALTLGLQNLVANFKALLSVTTE